MRTGSGARRAAVLGICALALLPRARGQDDFIDRIDDQLTFACLDDTVRMRVSGTADFEEYYVERPEVGIIYPEDGALFNPRLTLFLDTQIGRSLYGFVQARADDGFDPGGGGPRQRLDEYALRYTPLPGGLFNLQVGKFATMIGSWTPRHGSWDNPFVTAPLPYENLTGVWGSYAAPSSDALLHWAGILPHPNAGGAFMDVARNLPVVWGPSYASGAAVFGTLGRFEYALEMKNTSLASPPATWAPTATQWEHPTFSGRIAYLPDESWTLGISASEGPYLEATAAPFLPAGTSLGRYREILVGEDLSFAWHHFQLWAEAYESRFQIPLVGNADTGAYYVEARYAFAPRVFGAVRWNQQVFSSMTDSSGARAPWSRDAERVDLAIGFRLTVHVQAKLQYSLEHERADTLEWGQMSAAQLTVRF